VSFTAGYAAPRLLQPGVGYGDVPANGGLEAFTLGTSSPPDAWDVRAGAWGTDITAWSLPTSGFGIGGWGSAAVLFSANSTGRLSSRLFSVVQFGVYRLATSVLFYHPTSSPAANSVRVEVEWLSSAGSMLSTSTLDLSAVAGTEFVTRALELTAPSGAAFARVVGGRFAATAAAETFALSDVRVDRPIDPRTNGVGTAAIFDGAVTSAKLDTNIAVDGTFSAGSITQPSWIAPTLLNSFTNYDASIYQPAGYFKDLSGRVYLRGLLKRATGAFSTTIFTLPAGYRPAKLTLFALMAANLDGRLDVDASGNVFVPAATAANWYTFFSLDGMSFDTR
jgi:hypothetical protein